MKKTKAISAMRKSKKFSFNVFSKKGFMSLALVGVMVATPFVFTGCANGKDGQNGADGTIWKSGTSYTEFADAKVGDYFIDTDDYILYQKSADFWRIVMENYGKQGTPGNPGAPATAPIIAINQDGYWTINGESTGVKAEGKDGATWLTGTAIIGTGTGISATIANSKIGDLYFNTDNFDVYQCTAENTWNWLVNIKGQNNNSDPTEKVVDLVMFMGQSNMAGRGDYTLAPQVEEGHGYEFRAVSDPTKLYNIGEQAFGVNENRGLVSENKKTGSMVPAFMNSYYEQTGVPIVGVSSSKGGTSIDFWAPNGKALNESITRYNAAKEYLQNNGYTIRRQYMVWCQGETDGDNSMSKDDYKTKLTAMIEEMMKQGIEKTMLVRIGNHRTDATKYDDIILAQTELCAESDDVVLISGKFAGMAEDGLMKDSFHYTQEGYNIAGSDAGKNMAYYVKTGLEPYFYDSEYKNYYPFGNYDGNSNTGTVGEAGDNTVGDFLL